MPPDPQVIAALKAALEADPDAVPVRLQAGAAREGHRRLAELHLQRARSRVRSPQTAATVERARATVEALLN